MSDLQARRAWNKLNTDETPESFFHMYRERGEKPSFEEVLHSTVTGETKFQILNLIPERILPNGLRVRYADIVEYFPRERLKALFDIFYERQVSVVFQGEGEHREAFCDKKPFPRILGFRNPVDIDAYARILYLIQILTGITQDGIVLDSRADTQRDIVYSFFPDAPDSEAAEYYPNIPFGIYLGNEIVNACNRIGDYSLLDDDRFNVFFFEPCFFENIESYSTLVGDSFLEAVYRQRVQRVQLPTDLSEITSAHSLRENDPLNPLLYRYIFDSGVHCELTIYSPPRGELEALNSYRIKGSNLTIMQAELLEVEDLEILTEIEPQVLRLYFDPDKNPEHIAFIKGELFDKLKRIFEGSRTKVELFFIPVPSVSFYASDCPG